MRLKTYYRIICADYVPDHSILPRQFPVRLEDERVGQREASHRGLPPV